jgi:hypothetical protein
MKCAIGTKMNKKTLIAKMDGGVVRGSRAPRKMSAVSSYAGSWVRLHRAAAAQALSAAESDELWEEIQKIRDSLACVHCQSHLTTFLQRKKNQQWLKTDPEFFVYKLHAAANANARKHGRRSSLPPPYGATVARYRREFEIDSS